MSQDQNKKWFFKFLISFIIGLAVMAGITIVIDPYFHYHAPLDGISYRIYEERYTNDGITRHFDYSAMITGTSMNQNFKPSEWEALTGQKTIKVPYSGAGFKELSNAVRRAADYQENLDTVIWGIDHNGLRRDWDFDGYDNYPEYLYDANLYNDVSYVLNKSILYHGTVFDIFRTLSGEESTTLDEYASWDLGYGMEAIMRSYQRKEPADPDQGSLTPEEEEQVVTNIKKNLVDLAYDHPDITFHLFYTPYSIVYWDFVNQDGRMQKQFEAERIATQMLLECPNIRLYNFFGNYDLICDTDNYKDKEHYIAEVNSMILNWIAEGKYLVTKENYREMIEQNEMFYNNYDYESIFEGQ